MKDWTCRPLQSTPADRALGATLVREYVEGTAAEMAGSRSLQDMLLELLPYLPDYQDFDGRYGVPGASFLVVERGGQVGGGVGIIAADDGRCEMNRLWVRPDCRRQGLARALAEAALAEGVRLGYQSMALDVLNSRPHAVELYRTLGFEVGEPYHDFPYPMTAMEREL
jgi:putative acetyltransferase